MLIYNTLIITNVAKIVFILCAIYLIMIFLLIFLDTAHKKIFQTKILEMTSLVNHLPVNIISIDIAMSDS